MTSIIGKLLCLIGFHRIAIDLSSGEPKAVCLRCAISERQPTQA